MIKDEWRFFAFSGDIVPGGPSTWHILDWDQRRLISVTMDEEQKEEDRAIECLKKHVDSLEPDVYLIYVSKDGELISTSTDIRDDHTSCVYYPPLRDLQLPDGIQTVRRSELEELDRLGPNVDLVLDLSSSQADPKKVVFKYYFMFQFLFGLWHEMNLWMRLPKHPNIVPFDKVVVDELEGRAVGFTTLFAPGGTLDENRSRVFKLQWLEQLMDVVDDLNLKYGIVHQDIAPRNLLVDDETDTLMLFDFNYSARIGTQAYSEHRNDVKGVMFTIYEIITRDDRLRSVPYEQQDLADIVGPSEWIKHPDVKLDRPVSEYRSSLRRWAEKRRTGPQITAYKDAPHSIDWPSLGEAPLRVMNVIEADGTPGFHHYRFWDAKRRSERENGAVILSWERPPRSKLEAGVRLLANGEIMNRT
ncbi:hypothetical protein CONLIGDRAFT_586688 [Coniochaeta ligniaria NRRL 30616]|uniref:EKC/KEOPS complex subunit BUD32 n=1 Tax=Coniochaeta ligniaria NRRL 30616 TaxID=1408157 RepID=A0A1J7INW0_9PEZI|nr:hypothetical protein CONLIGDRAFT_586688 [Coniochaeta ligniaria NRRL 30616]